MDEFVRWCPHKAVLRGLSIKLASQKNKKRDKALIDIMDEIKRLDDNNKANTPHALTIA